MNIPIEVYGFPMLTNPIKTTKNILFILYLTDIAVMLLVNMSHKFHFYIVPLTTSRLVRIMDIISNICGN